MICECWVMENDYFCVHNVWNIYLYIYCILSLSPPNLQLTRVLQIASVSQDTVLFKETYDYINNSNECNEHSFSVDKEHEISSPGSLA